jgi:hypothetical protein
VYSCDAIYTSQASQASFYRINDRRKFQVLFPPFQPLRALRDLRRVKELKKKNYSAHIHSVKCSERFADVLANI